MDVAVTGKDVHPLPCISSGRQKCREAWPSLGLERTFTLCLSTGLLLLPLLVMTAAYISISVALYHGIHVDQRVGTGN